MTSTVISGNHIKCFSLSAKIVDSQTSFILIFVLSLKNIFMCAINVLSLNLAQPVNNNAKGQYLTNLKLST